jgi:LPXTG-site transpeptidase (sortase) family protein
MHFVLRLLITIFTVIGLCLLLAPMGYVLAVSNPEIWYSIHKEAVEDEITALSQEPIPADVSLPRNSGFITNIDTNPQPEKLALPPINPNIAPGRRIMVPSIGINTNIYESATEREGLEKGVWRMPKHGTPIKNEQPFILAAHRWGNIRLTRAFRQQHLFYNLPKIEIGQEVIVHWDQREFVYRVNYKEQIQYVSRLDDLIMITCQFVGSPERIIVYATRIK